MSGLIQGLTKYNNNIVTVLGFSDKYLYRLVSNEETPKRGNISAPVLVIDFSWSMQNSNSAKPALESVKNTCKKLFEDGHLVVMLVFFGKTSYTMEVESCNYLGLIDDKMRNYFNSSYFFETDGCFNPTGTNPELAFDQLFKEIKKNPKSSYNIIFMTDGEFNGSINYASKWQELASQLSCLKSEFEFYTIGYQNDYLKNIIEMKTAFEKVSCSFNYHTISSTCQIEPKMKEITDLFENYDFQKVVLPNGDTLIEGDQYFCSELLFKDLESATLINIQNLPKGITESWILDVLGLTIDLGLKEQSVVNKMKKIVNEKNAKELYQNLVKELSLFYNCLPQKFLSLRNQVKSLKSRKIYVWTLLNERMQSFCDKFREIQDLVSNELNEKKQFEIATQIANSIKSRHLRTLQRRRINNEANKKQEDEYTIELESEEPVSITLQKGEVTKKIILESKLNDLDNYYTCFYTQDNWSDMLNNLAGIPIKYNWKESDDWTPSRANIENVSLSGFISQEGFNEVQSLFGKQNTDHTNLYKNEAYIKSAHDGTNAYLPIAIEPFFLDKLSLVKERLGHMIAGSNLAFASRHVMLYVAVIRQLVNMILDNPTEKLQHTLLLVLNTFRLLTLKCNCIFNKDQTPLSKSDILLNIANGNTAPYLFTSPWDSSVYALVSSNSDYENANNLYCQQTNTNVSLAEFKSLVWKMVFRHFLINKYELDSKFEDPLIWNLPNHQQVKEKLENYLKSMSYETAIMEINSEMMSTEKLKVLPEYIKEQVQKSINSRIVKIYLKLFEISQSLSDDTWSQLNKTFLPFKLSENLNKNIDEQYMINSVFWTYWECNIYGQKDCYPLKNYSELEKHIINRINNNYGDQIKLILADAYELAEFRKRNNETRALPVIFNNNIKDAVNEIFSNVFNGKMTEQNFKNEMRTVLGHYSCEQFDDALQKDNVDVLNNLYNYCKLHNHTITIKPSCLPFSCPANPTSPIFLQKLTDVGFSQYYRPLGLGWSTKKYQKWVHDLHPYMVNNLYKNEQDFIDTVLEHVKIFIPLGHERYTDYIKSFYIMFK